MRLPTRDSIEGLRPISRNLSLDLIAAIGVGVAGALVSSLLPTIARRGGLEPLGLAVLAATPFLTNLLSVFSGRIGPQTTRQFALLRVAGAGSLVVLLVVSPALVIIAVALVFWISVSFSSPFQLRLWGATYPARMRGRVVGFLGTGRIAAAALAALIGGLLADRIGGPPAVAPRRARRRGLRPGLLGLPGVGRRRARSPTRPANRSTRCASGPPSAASPSPRASSAAASSPPARCSPWSTSIGWTCRCPTSASSASCPPWRRRSRS